MTTVLSRNNCIEHTHEEALASGCTFCGESLRMPYVFYNLGRHVFMCAECCVNGDGILLDMHRVRRGAFPQSRRSILKDPRAPSGKPGRSLIENPVDP